MNEKIKNYWDKFLKDTNRDASTMWREIFHFCNNEKDANLLLELVLKGKKKASSSLPLAYELEGEELPQVGDLSIVTDWYGNPGCVIKTVQTTFLPFKNMSYEICSREGEDETLESWQEGHVKFFTEDLASYGRDFSWDMEILFEDFELIYQ